MNATVPVGWNWGRLRSATLAVRMTGRPSAVDRGLIERNVRVDKGLELGEEDCSFGAGRGGGAGFGVVGRVEIGVGVGVGVGRWRGWSASVLAWVTALVSVLGSASASVSASERRPRT